MDVTICLCLLLSVTAFSSAFIEDPTCQPTQEGILMREGDVLLVGLFDNHDGDDCDVIKTGGQQQMYAASAAVDWVNNNSFGGNINFGFMALDTCSEGQKAIKQIIYGLVETEYINSCNEQQLLGFLGPSSNRIIWDVSNFLKPLSIPYLPIRITNLHLEIQALVALLVHFDWRQVALLTASQELETDFHKIATKSNICVTVSSVLKYSREEYDEFFLRMTETSTTVVVLLATEEELLESIQSASAITQTCFYWLAAGMMSKNINFDVGKYRNVIRSLVIVESSEIISDEKEIFEQLEENMKADKRCRSFDCHRNILDPVIRQTIKGVLRYSAAVRKLQDEECTLEPYSCLRTNLITKLEDESNELPLLFETQNITIFSYQREKRKHKAHFYQVGYFAYNELKIDTKKMDILQPMGGGWFKIPHFRCEDECFCVNTEEIRYEFQQNLTLTGIWKKDTWVTVCVTISCIGILMALVILIFVLYHICSDEPTEGHHGFTLLTLIGIIILYIAMFPYAFSPTETICAFRIAVLGLGYAAVFSPIAARCLMLATSGTLGLTMHINGILQGALYCFIFGIQIALSVQYWWLNWNNHVVHGPNREMNCNVNETFTVTTVTYDMFLLALLLFSTPFCIKARRNHREGLFFHLASLVTFAVWVTWFTLYFVFYPEWTEPILCLGFVATATAIMVIIFLPRVYKIATTSSRNNSKMRLRSIDQLTSSTRTNSMSRNLYSSVKTTYGGSESNCQPLKDEPESDVYDDSTLPAVTHL